MTARNGFTLLEVLVALAVFAVAALALLRLEAAGLTGSADLDARLLRDVVAGNLATQWQSDPTLAKNNDSAGGVTVNGGQRFAWQREVHREGGVVIARFMVRGPGEEHGVALARAARTFPDQAPP